MEMNKTFNWLEGFFINGNSINFMNGWKSPGKIIEIHWPDPKQNIRVNFNHS